MSAFTTIVLAGDRGNNDPLIASTKVSRKALVRIHGKPMLLIALEALVASKHVGQILVVANRVKDMEASARIRDLVDEHAIQFVEGAGSPAASILKTLEDGALAYPVFVTTADNAVTTTAMYDEFLSKSLEAPADISVGMVARTNFRAKYPDVKRTFVNLRRDGYSGANLFALHSKSALNAVAFWTSVENDRKKAGKLVARFGLGGLLLKAFGLLDLDGAMARASKAMKATVRAVLMSDPEAAMDVDRPDHIPVVEGIWQAREDGSKEESQQDS